MSVQVYMCISVSIIYMYLYACTRVSVTCTCIVASSESLSSLNSKPYHLPTYFDRIIIVVIVRLYMTLLCLT